MWTYGLAQEGCHLQVYGGGESQSADYNCILVLFSKYLVSATVEHDSAIGGFLFLPAPFQLFKAIIGNEWAQLGVSV